MHEGAIVRDSRITADECVRRQCVSEDFDFEHIANRFLSLFVEIRMHKCNVVIACDYIAKSTQTLVDAFYLSERK